MPLKFIDLERQFHAYRQEIEKAISEVLESTRYILGKSVSDLEDTLSSYVGVPHGIGVSSGTDALLISLMAYKIKREDEVICPVFTFFSVPEVIALLGARPVFADIDENTYNIDPESVRENITERTRGIIAVSMFGQVADMDAINSIASEYGLFVIEDGCQSFGATYKGRKSCGLSEVGVTSFFPSKPLGCYGDGGMIFTTNPELAELMRSLRVHGQTERYEHKYIGINGRLDTIQAAILLVKFRHFEEEIKLRQIKAKYYTDNLKDICVTPYIEPHNISVYSQYSIRIDRRDDLCRYLNQQGIPTAVHYPKPLHLQEAFSYLGYKKGDFPVSEKVSEEIVSLPMSPFISQEEQDLVIEGIHKFIRGG